MRTPLTESKVILYIAVTVFAVLNDSGQQKSEKELEGLHQL